MRVSRLAIAALGAIFLLSGCSNGNSDSQAKALVASADRQKQVDEAISAGCKYVNRGSFSAALPSFGLAARLNPGYLEVARAAYSYNSLKDLVPNSTNTDLKTKLANDLIVVAGFCNGA